jgi:hypothetical protein
LHAVIDDQVPAWGVHNQRGDEFPEAAWRQFLATKIV